MAPGKPSSNARTALSSRYQPYPTDMAAAQRQQASSSFHADQRSPKLFPTLPPVVLRYEKSQDSMAVKSIEGQESGLTGVRHYLSMLKQNKLDSKPSLDYIDYRSLSSPSDTRASQDLDEADIPRPSHTVPPSPPAAPAAYNQPIYVGSTHNPSVFLAILRIAQLNLPHLNLVSALNHIPNVRPDDSLPPLTPSAPGNLAPMPFLDKTRPVKRAGDVDVTVAFLPYFYNGGKTHAIVYFQYLHDPRRGRVLGSACITPSSEEDLRRFGLVEYIDAEDLIGVIGQLDEGGIEGVDLMSEVGCAGGEWLERDTVEQYEAWKAVFRTCAVAWEMRMGLLRGEVEG